MICLFHLQNWFYFQTKSFVSIKFKIAQIISWFLDFLISWFLLPVLVISLGVGKCALLPCECAVNISLQTSVKQAGCKENHFYSLPFGQAEASVY